MRRAAKVDSNQYDIVKSLRDIPGVTVSTGKDDILVGRNGVTYWFEIKTPDKVKRDGKLKTGALKDSQIELLNNWKGHYKVVWNKDQILREIGIIC